MPEEKPKHTPTGKIVEQIKTLIDEAGLCQFTVLINDPDTDEHYFLIRDQHWSYGIMNRYCTDMKSRWEKAVWDEFSTDDGDEWKYA